MKSNASYRYLKARDLVQYGDERWDGEDIGWVIVEDRHMGRFSDEYRRVGSKCAKECRFRRRTR